MDSGILYIVATPIGNLEDITLRALRVLKEVDYVLCEDTRVTSKLLKYYEITTKMKRYDAHTSSTVHEEIVADLLEGKKIALVSDAGTPGISDPGVLLVKNIRESNDGHPMSNIKVEAIPGPSAVTAAFSIAGLSGNQFSFLGFVPQKKGRETFFVALSEYDHPVLFFESPHRIIKTLESLTKFQPEKTITVAREITKLFEEVFQGSPEGALEYFTEKNVRQKGEFVVIVS